MKQNEGPTKGHLRLLADGLLGRISEERCKGVDLFCQLVPRQSRWGHIETLFVFEPCPRFQGLNHSHLTRLLMFEKTLEFSLGDNPGGSDGIRIDQAFGFAQGHYPLHQTSHPENFSHRCASIYVLKGEYCNRQRKAYDDVSRLLSLTYQYNLSRKESKESLSLCRQNVQRLVQKFIARACGC